MGWWACWKKPTVIEAWVNWNPEPTLHAFGAATNRRVLALCRVVVRQRRGTFDPSQPEACPDCAEFVRAGLSFEEASKITNERMRARMSDPATIACRR